MNHPDKLVDVIAEELKDRLQPGELRTRSAMITNEVRRFLAEEEDDRRSVNVREPVKGDKPHSEADAFQVNFVMRLGRAMQAIITNGKTCNNPICILAYAHPGTCLTEGPYFEALRQVTHPKLRKFPEPEAAPEVVPPDEWAVCKNQDGSAIVLRRDGDCWRPAPTTPEQVQALVEAANRGAK